MSVPDWLDDLPTISSNVYSGLINKLKSCDYRLDNLEHEFFTSKEWSILNDIENVDLEGIVEHAITSGISLSKVISDLTWTEFESIIAFVLDKSGWVIDKNFRYFGEGAPSTRKRYEIDIVATKKPYIVLIDCKRYKTPNASPMKDAAISQKERTFVFYEQLPIIHDGITSNFPLWQTKGRLLPLILTWKHHQLTTFENVAIVSVDFFEDFFVNLDLYIEEHHLFELTWDTHEL